jgi:GT2 family glycosyltransferase
MLIRRQAVEAIGGFDEQFFLYWEDADLCWRLHEQGWQVVYDPQVRVIHQVGGSSKHASMRSLVAFHRSAYLLYRKQVTGSAWHPLSVVAAVGLSVRAAGLLAWEGVRKLCRG